MRSLDLDPAVLDRLAGDVLAAVLDWTTTLDGRSIRPDASGAGLLDLFADVVPEKGLRSR